MAENESSSSIVEWLLSGPGSGSETSEILRLRIERGWAIPESDGEAEAYLESLAKEGDSDACRILGLMLDKGIGVHISESGALDWYIKAADCGDSFSAKRAGEICRDLGNTQWFGGEEPTYWDIGARYGNVDCIRGLGVACETEGTEESLAEAVRLYRKGAEMGDIKAVRCIGNLYERGLGLPKSYEKAAEWYRKSAEQGYAEAQCDLGYFYDKGMGVAQNYPEAARLYRLSAAQGCARAMNNLGLL